MSSRRQFLIGSLSMAAAAAAAALAPRRSISLLKAGTVSDIIPGSFGDWASVENPGTNSPETEGELARTLYSEIVQRIYRHNTTGVEVMLLAAYGKTQSDLLQLHRPEICYQAVGFAITASRPTETPVAGVNLPSRELVAAANDRNENILYWTRIGEALPQSGREQRAARLSNAMHGFTSDGILMRTSIVGDSESSFVQLAQFVPAMLVAVARKERPVLIGSELARRMTA